MTQNNLYGLDIDERAAQLSYFAVMMKARQYDRRFLAKKDADGKPDIPQPHVYVIEESNSIKPEALNELGQNLTQYERDNALEQIIKLIEEMYDAKEYGSLTSVSVFDWNLLRRFAKLTTDNGQMRINMHDEEQTSRKLQKLIDIGEALAQKYEVIVTNPPYMGNSGMNGKLAVWVKDNYPDSKSDLFAVFIERGRDFVIRNGFNCMVTMQSWMFLSSFEKMRNKLIQTMSISSLMHMENMVMGIAFGTAVSVFRNSHLAGYRGTYNQIKLVDIDNDAPKEFPIKGNRFAQVSTDNFSKIPGYPVAYWISSQMTAIFSHQTLSEFFISGGRNKTHNDDKYIRLLWEVPRSNKWSLYAKGGAYRKWYGDIYYVVDWTDNAKAEYASHGGLVNKSFWGKAGITWTIVTAYKASFRYKQEAVIYSSVSPTIFNSNYSLDKYTLALLNSKIAETLLDIMNPTLAYNVSNILDIPYIESDRVDIENLVQNNINISKSEWDSFETSFDFKRHPLIEINDICKVNFIRECFQKWNSICDARFSSLKENEEKINQKFIDIYGLSNELSPDIDDKDGGF